jgi:hypothetical protein
MSKTSNVVDVAGARYRGAFARGRTGDFHRERFMTQRHVGGIN